MITQKYEHSTPHTIRMLPMRYYSAPEYRMSIPCHDDENQQTRNILHYTPSPLANYIHYSPYNTHHNKIMHNITQKNENGTLKNIFLRP